MHVYVFVHVSVYVFFRYVFGQRLFRQMRDSVMLCFVC